MMEIWRQNLDKGGHYEQDVKTGPYDIQSGEQQKLLWICIDNKLTFDKIVIIFAQRPAKNLRCCVECHRS